MTKVMNINKEEVQSTEVTDVKVNSEETNTPKTLEQLEEEQKNLSDEVNQDAKDLTTALYEIDFVNESNISNAMKYLDKNLEWSIKEAALYVELYKTLKSEKSRIKNATEDNEKLVRLTSMNLNTLYNSMTLVKGKGISQAKSFLTLLTNIGNVITENMNKMAANNKVVQDKHVILSELDKAIGELKNPAEDADEVIEAKS